MNSAELSELIQKNIFSGLLAGPKKMLEKQSFLFLQ